MPSSVLDIEQHLLLLELDAPFDKRDVQLARRRMAKRWHPDIAPPGKQHEHQRHLQAINDMADELERLADGSRGGKISRSAARWPTPSSTLPRTSLDSSRWGSCSSRPTETPGASIASPRNSLSRSAMIASSDDFPEPL